MPFRSITGHLLREKNLHLLFFIRLSFPTLFPSCRCAAFSPEEGNSGVRAVGGGCFLKGLEDSLPPLSHHPVGNEQSLGFQTHLFQCRLSSSMLLPIE